MFGQWSIMRPTVNQLWVEREFQWCEEANPFCLDSSDEDQLLALEDLLISSFRSLCLAGQHNTPSAPRSGVLRSTQEYITAFDELITDIKRERDVAHQRARSAIDRIGVRTSSTSTEAGKMQCDSNIKSHSLSLPPGAILRSPSSINAHQALLEQRQRPTMVRPSEHRFKEWEHAMPLPLVDRILNAPSQPAKSAYNNVVAEHSQSAWMKSGTKVAMSGSPGAGTHDYKRIVVAPLPSASPFARQGAQHPHPNLATTLETPQVKGDTDWFSQSLSPASELPHCFTQSAAQLHQRLKSRGILAALARFPHHVAVAH